MKKYVVLLWLFLLCPVCFAATPLYKYENTVPISNAVSLTTVKEFYSDKNMSYSYIKADISDENTDLELLKSKSGVDVLEKVSTLASTDSDVVGAVNGDFFSWYSGNSGFPLGIEIKDGVLLGSPIYPETMASVAYDNNSVLMTYMDFELTVTAPNGKSEKIRHLNKHTDYYGDILMYTSSFNGGYSPAPGGPVCEIVVEDGIMTEYRKNMPAVKIPENGFVLCVSEWVSMFLTNNFKVGDPVVINCDMTPFFENCKTAFGAGSMLVSEGQDVGKIGDYTHTVAGYNPRTAIGVDKEGTTVYIVTVDGRQDSSAGMRMSHLAELMISLGCYNAVNLDGGGSTRMVASTLWQPEMSVINSPTEDRKVINAVGITVNESEDKTPCGIALKAENEYTYVGQQIKIDFSVYDENMRKIDVDERELVWISSCGNVENGTFTPNVGGRATVTAQYEGAFGTIEIDVLENVCGITLQKSMTMLLGESVQLQFSVFDSFGRNVDVTNYKAFEFESSNDDVIAVDSNGKLTAKGEGVAKITVSKNGVSATSVVSCGKYTSEYVDEFEDATASFASDNANVKGNFSLSTKYAFSGHTSGMLEYDFSLLEEAGYDTASAYCKFSSPIEIDPDCTEITLNVFSEEGLSHSLYARFFDGNGDMITLELEGNFTPRIWRVATVKIPEDTAFPLKLTHLCVTLEKGELFDKGAVYFDDMSLLARVEYGELKNRDVNSYRKDVVNTNVISTVAIGAVSTSANNALISYSNNRITKLISSSDNFATVGNISSYSAKSDKYALYISLDTSKGGMRKTDKTQWDKMVEAINKTDKEYVFVMSNGNLFGDDEFENDTFCDYLADCGKKIYVVTCGSYSDYKSINGVEFFTLCNDDGINSLSFDEKCANVLKFTLGDTETFEFLK